MRISIITPTCDQPTGIALCERYMARQTVQPHQWIVADDGHVPALLTMGQEHAVRPRRHEGGRSLAGNMLAALERVSSDTDVVVCWEHDDYYLPTHIEVCLSSLAHADATGSQWQRYYNIASRSYRVMRNIGSALCNTAFRASLIPAMQDAAHKAFKRNAIGVDRLFWDSIRGDVHDINTVVGIKGLPGRKGLGIGHRPDHRFTPDPDFAKLREWIGDDAEFYTC